MKRGWEYDLVAEVVLEGKRVFKQTFTLLSIAKHRTEAPVDDPKTVETTTTPQQRDAACTLTPRDTDRWADLTQDRNPIHLHTPFAKLMGLRGRIAHGNHVVATAVAAVDAARGAVGEKSAWMEIDFRRPVFIPAQLDVACDDGLLRVWTGEKLMVDIRHG